MRNALNLREAFLTGFFGVIICENNCVSQVSWNAPESSLERYGNQYGNLTVRTGCNNSEMVDLDRPKVSHGARPGSLTSFDSPWIWNARSGQQGAKNRSGDVPALGLCKVRDLWRRIR